MIYLVFVGASSKMADEINKIGLSWNNLRVIAPAMNKTAVGLNVYSIKTAFQAAISVLKAKKNLEEKNRFVVLSFPSASFDDNNNLISTFGAAAWIEFISNENIHKASKLRTEIESRLRSLLPFLHEISTEIHGRRHNSPLCLPLKNFSGQVTTELKTLWYQRQSYDDFKNRINRFRGEFCRLKDRTNNAFLDDQGLSFSPAASNACHGIAHPTGDSDTTYVRGKFRFGASLYSGFHYDVQDGKGRTLKCSLRDADLGLRLMQSENRHYINVHPNDVLLPRK